MHTVWELRRCIADAVQAAESTFDQLVFLGSLRNTYDGRYMHEGWRGLGEANEVHGLLRDTHDSVFGSVLRLSVVDLGKELRLHFLSNNYPEGQTCRLWLELEPFRDLVPQGCSIAVRKYFVLQIRTALQVLLLAPNWSDLAEPIALRHSRLGRSPLLQYPS